MGSVPERCDQALNHPSFFLQAVPCMQPEGHGCHLYERFPLTDPDDLLIEQAVILRDPAVVVQMPVKPFSILDVIAD